MGQSAVLETTLPRPKRDDVAVKIDAKVYRKAKVVAAARGITIAEYVTDVCRPTVERDYQRMVRQMANDEDNGRAKH